MDSRLATMRVFHSQLVVYFLPGRKISLPLATEFHPAQLLRRARLSHRQGTPKSRFPILQTLLVCLSHLLIAAIRRLTKVLRVTPCFIQTGRARSQYLQRCTSDVPGRIIGPISGASPSIRTSQLIRLSLVSPTLFAPLPAFSTSPTSLFILLRSIRVLTFILATL